MKAKDTVMTLEQLNEIPEWDSMELTPVLEAQVEITGKIMYDEGFKAGMKYANKARLDRDELKKEIIKIVTPACTKDVVYCIEHGACPDCESDQILSLMPDKEEK